MRVFDRLNIELSRQAQADDRRNDDHEAMRHYDAIAAGYAEMENAIVVLSDLRRNVSHVHLGKYALNFSVEFQDGRTKFLSLCILKILNESISRSCVSIIS